MNFYEHTLITRQDISPSQIKQIQDKYSKIIESNEGNILKFESWGLLHLSYLIKKNKKGNYLHFKIEGKGKTIKELEKIEKIDKNLLRYLTVKVKKLDLETDYFKKIAGCVFSVLSNSDFGPLKIISLKFFFNISSAFKKYSFTSVSYTHLTLPTNTTV